MSTSLHDKLNSLLGAIENNAEKIRTKASESSLNQEEISEILDLTNNLIDDLKNYARLNRGLP